MFIPGSPDRQVSCIEVFELEALDEALERFAELRPDTHRVPPNSAVRTNDRWQQLVESGRPANLASFFAPGHATDDRRSHAQLTVGTAEEILNARWLLEGGWRVTRTLLAVAGDRLLLEHFDLTKGEPGADAQIQFLQVVEIDAEGRAFFSALFDPHERPAASAELFERYVAQGAEGMPPGAIEFFRGWSAHDLVRVRSGMADDLVPADHRRTGMGRIDDADTHVASVGALYELIPDVRIDILYDLQMCGADRVCIVRSSGRNPEGGEVEAVLVVIMLHRGDKHAYAEFFEIEDLDRAVARFEELRGARIAQI